ncbi:hypothetical protein [Saccharopolyspora shandongensis]|uniref:hypothetical protein n=1 Tax=Saccharopolyspora shandongensis TaxID=418495 RepID=UPI0033C9EB96
MKMVIIAFRVTPAESTQDRAWQAGPGAPMDRKPRRTTENEAQTGFTAIFCGSCGESGELPLVAALRETVRRSPHGVLVRAACPLGHLWCHIRKTSTAHATGQVVLVQRCTSTRRPLGPIILVGPVETAEDIAELTRWLETTPATVDGLPQRLRRFHQAVQN